MKQLNFLKKSLIVSLLCATGSVSAQIHPLAFGPKALPAGTGPSNWYADYVGLRFEITSPAAIAGDKGYTTSYNTGTTSWGGAVPPIIINKPLIMPQAGDSLAGSTITVSMTGKVGLVYRGTVEFGAKALACQTAGAIACVIINNVPGGPVGMGAGAVGASVTIPVFMISKEDGDLLDAQYCSGAPCAVTITNWGQNYNNDIGFIPGGTAGWHDFAIPKSQLASSGNPSEYRGMNGAFIGNFGFHKATGVQVTSKLSFTPTGGSASQIYADSSGVLSSFDNTNPSQDSIYAMFGPSDYNLPATSGTGRFDLVYQIKSDSVDQFPADNSITSSFYSTDSLFSKGRYDFTASTPQPLRSIYRLTSDGSEYLWGPMYYVSNGGVSVSRIQYSLAMNIVPPASPLLTGQNNVYLFKWIDGLVTGGVTYPKDSIVQNGELQLVSLGIKIYDNLNDTSRALLTLTTMRDSNGVGLRPNLDAHSWYYLAVDVPSSTGVPVFLGADGIANPYPRIYGRYKYNGILDYASITQLGPNTVLYGTGNQANAVTPGSATTYVQSIDSFNFASVIGAIPAVAIITGPAVTAVKNVSSQPFANVSLYPNPANKSMTVSLDLQQPAKSVTYEIIDGLARFVSKEVHNNVQNEKNVMSTQDLAPGNYYLIITADDKIMSRTFTVIR